MAYQDYDKETDEGKDEVSMIQRIKRDLAEARKKYNPIYKRVREDQAFAAAVDDSQYGTEDDAVRGKDRAKWQLPMIDKYIERIVGSYNASPFGINYSSFRPENAPKATILSGIVGGIEARSKAKDSYRAALRNASTSGYAWLYVTTEWADPESEGLDVELLIDHVLNPASVLSDPTSVRTDGTDADWRAHVDYISPREARDRFGEEVLMSLGSGCDLWDESNSRDQEAETVPVITYYYKSRSRKTLFIGPEGKSSEKRVDGWRMKEVTKTRVKMCKVVGNRVVEEQDMGLRYIPIVPVYGLPAHIANKADYVGIVNRAKHAQKLMNYAASLGAERMALGPKAYYMAANEAIQSTLEVWKNSARSNPPVLTYDAFTPDGAPIPSPTPLNPAVDIGDTMAMQASMRDTIAAVIGMPEDGIGGVGPRDETAEAALLRAKAAETILSTLYENLATAIEQLGRVLLDAITVYYDTPRDLPVKIGKSTSREMIDLPAMGIVPTEYEVSVDAGPLLSTQRKENARSYLAMAQVLGQQYLPALAPKIAQSIDGTDEEMIQQIAMISQQAMQPVTDPQAMAMAQQENQMLRQELLQVQEALKASNNSLIANQQKIQADLLKTQMQNENRLDVERLKLQGGMVQTEMKIGADQQKQGMSVQGDMLRDDRKAELDAEKAILEAQLDLEKDMAKQRAEQDAMDREFLDAVQRLSGPEYI